MVTLLGTRSKDLFYVQSQQIQNDRLPVNVTQHFPTYAMRSSHYYAAVTDFERMKQAYSLPRGRQKPLSVVVSLFELFLIFFLGFYELLTLFLERLAVTT